MGWRRSDVKCVILQEYPDIGGMIVLDLAVSVVQNGLQVCYKGEVSKFLSLLCQFAEMAYANYDRSQRVKVWSIYLLQITESQPSDLGIEADDPESEKLTQIISPS